MVGARAGIVRQSGQALPEEGIPVGGGSDGRSCEWRTNILFWADATRESRLAGVLGPELALTRKKYQVSHY